MTELQDFCLRWSSYTQQLSEALRTLFDRELLVDVTLACDGRSLRAHRAILSACSTYFQELFQESTHPHPIVILKDVRYQELEALVKFMYHGEVTVNHDILPGFLRTAETLHVRGLTDSALSGNTSPINTSKVANGNRRSLDGDGSLADQDANSHRISPVHIKNIKTEQPTTPQYQHPVRLPQNQDLDGSMNGGSTDEGNISAQNSHCPIRTEELSHLNEDQYTVHRNITSLDGLSQLVMPVIQDDSSHSSPYIGICANIQNQHHPQVPQPPQPLQHHQITQHGNNIGPTGSGASRPFRQRVLYNQEQLLQLEAWYRQDRYPSGALMREYADTLAAMVPNTPGSIGAQPMRQNVDYWFQNRRRKDFHPEVMQQREKKKLAKTLWGNYNVPNPQDTSNDVHPEDISNNR